MKIEEFDALGVREKTDLLYKDGVYIGKRQIASNIAILFQLETFYVEIVYQDYRLKIKQIISSGSTDLLIPYLHQVPVSLMGIIKGKQ